MSLYGKKVIAVLDTNSTFGVKFQKVIDDVDQVSAQMASLLLDAPAQLDTLKELADALGNDPSYFTTIAGQVDELNTDVTAAMSALGIAENDINMGTFTSAVLPDTEDLKSVLETFAESFTDAKTALEGADTAAGLRLDALENDRTTASALAAAVTTLEGADTALSGRLDILEADPTTKTYVDTQISDLIGGAPDLLNTLDEIAAAISDDENVYTTLTNADTALSNRLDVLELNPTTQTAVNAVQADVDQNELDSDAADLALSNRLDVLEADPTTATALAAVQTELDTEESTRATNDAALSTRIDALEVDPTTQTALTNGLALKADLTGATFTGDVIIDEGTGSTVKLETSDATSAGIHIEGPTGSMGYIDTTNGFGNDSLQVYSANFWVRAINGGTGNVIIDGGITAGGLVNAANDGDAATAGVPVNGLYHHNGSVKIRLS